MHPAARMMIESIPDDDVDAPSGSLQIENLLTGELASFVDGDASVQVGVVSARSLGACAHARSDAVQDAVDGAESR